ncbi:MAG: TatD family hydrolase [Alphaproteobacteria bacterium]|nr:TatD family hydrolase [Alphaproteobacteria bacterium]
MFIDTHCHLTDNYCDGGTDDVIKRAMDTGVGVMVCPTAEPKDIKGAIKLTSIYDNVFATIGIHPEYADNADTTQYLTPDVLNNPKVIGVGEIGLDYHERDDNKKNQIKLFADQLEIAKQFDLPVAIHTRDAESDTRDILTNANHGVMHCYTSSWDLAKTMLDRGFYFSASGILTFKNAVEVRETFAQIPTDRIVIETDSPFCAPVPYRGKQCEPAFVVETAKVLAQIKNLQIDELETILANNTKQLYPKIKIK